MTHNIPQFTVSELSRSMKRLVEDNFGYVQIKGEISGFKKATSGHLYFNLKDEKALINAVCFKNMASLINFDIEDGLEVAASGRVSIYEGRSNYQIIVEKLEMAGIGAILAAIEKRKAKLAKEGLFDAVHKKPIPFLPNKIGVITSPKGAVIEDILNRISERFGRQILLYPAAMQGQNAASDVINGLQFFEQASEDERPDVIIIARGGGSFEDLLPFNEESLVRAVFAAKIPVISAVGHETDTTLLDYVADLRAPTPTAAAEKAVPVRADLQNLLNNLDKRLQSYQIGFVNNCRQNLQKLASSMQHPRHKLQEMQQKFNQLQSVLNSALIFNLKNKQQNLQIIAAKMTKPTAKYENLHNKLNFLEQNLHKIWQNTAQIHMSRVNFLDQMLKSYSYKNVLKRGYAAIRKNGKIISSKELVKNNQAINIELSDGGFDAIAVQKIPKKPHKIEASPQQPSLFDSLK